LGCGGAGDCEFHTGFMNLAIVGVHNDRDFRGLGVIEAQGQQQTMNVPRRQGFGQFVRRQALASGFRADQGQRLAGIVAEPDLEEEHAAARQFAQVGVTIQHGKRAGRPNPAKLEDRAKLPPG
jgi:hypothetical protein